MSWVFLSFEYVFNKVYKVVLLEDDFVWIFGLYVKDKLSLLVEDWIFLVSEVERCLLCLIFILIGWEDSVIMVNFGVFERLKWMFVLCIWGLLDIVDEKDFE